MSVFVARYFKKNHNNSKLLDICVDFLPRRSKSFKEFCFKNSDAVVFSFGAALDRNPFQYKSNEVMICQGYGDKNLESRTRLAFCQEKPLDLINFPEAFCAVRVHDFGLEFSGSAVGADPIFYYVDDDLVVVTNRHNMLAPWVKKSDLRKDALAWMLGRGHIGDFGTCWDKIQKTRPGTLYKFKENLFNFNSADFSNLFNQIKDDEIIHRVSSIANDFRDILDLNQSECRFWLSGGKDSRAIAGLLSGSERFKEITFQTHGEKFAPDVMAATAVARELGVLDHYSTARSSLTEPTINLPRAIARDLLSDCTGGSLADFRSIPDSNLLIFGGHESGYKTPPNILNLDDYLDSRRYWSDNQQILTPDAYDKIQLDFRRDLNDLLKSAPKSRFPQIEALVYVIGTRVTGAHSNSHVSRSEIHPFLDGRMVQLLFGVSDEALRNQMIHYAMMRQSSSVIESLPFAADGWPSDTVNFAKKINYPFRSLPQNPYPFRSYFPSQKKFGGYSWRLDLIKRTRSFVKSYINENKEYFNFIDLKRFNFLVDADVSSLGISSIYFHLSILKVCLTHYFNEDGHILDFRDENLIADKIEKLIGGFEMKNGDEKLIIDAYKAKIEEYENAMAIVAERDRVAESELKKTINFNIAKKISELINDRDKLCLELKKLDYDLLSKDGISLGFKDGKLCVDGYIVNTSKKLNTLLLAIKNRSKNNVVPNLKWSDAGSFWFMYINQKDGDGSLSMEIDLGTIGGEVFLLPWYCEDPIFVSDILTH